MLSFLADDPPDVKPDLGAVEVKEEPLYETPTSSFTEGIVTLHTSRSCSAPRTATGSRAQAKIGTPEGSIEEATEATI